MPSLSGSSSFHYHDSRPSSKAPQKLELDLDSMGPWQTSPRYTLRDLRKHSEEAMTPSDDSSVSSFDTASTSSSPGLEGYPSEQLTITIQSLEDSGDEDTCFSSSRKAIRPLPLPPVPLSAPPSLSPRTRPLPRTPYLDTNSGVSISVTPATPMSPPQTPYGESPSHLSPPKIRRLPKPYSSLSLQTSLDALAPPAYLSATDSVCTSPISLSIPQLPTPTSARRKRMSKLKRYLGETVPDDLVPIISSASDPQTAKDLLSQLSAIGIERDGDEANAVPLDPAVIARKLRELEDDQSSGEEDEEEDDIVVIETEETEGRESRDSWVVGEKPAFHAIPLKRYSTKWLWDKGGRRWEEQDYDDIMCALRSL